MKDELFRDVCEYAPDLIQTVSLDGRFRYVNRAWRERLGYRRAEIEPLRLADTIAPDSQSHCERLFEQAAAGKMPLRLNAVLVAKDGTRIPVDGWVAGSRSTDEPMATASFRPVSFEERSRHQLGRLFDLSLDVLCIAGLDGYFRLINPTFVRLLGYPREELLSRRFVEFVHPDDRGATLDRLELLASGEAVIDFSNRYRTSDGRWLWLDWRSAPARDDGLIYAVARDITQERRARQLIARQAEELGRSNEDLEQFAYAASHDLQAPLRTISSLAGFIAEDMPEDLPDSVRKHLVDLDDKVAHMRELIEDLLAYSRAGHLGGEIEPVDTGQQVARVVRLLHPPESTRIEVDPLMPVLETSRSALELVFRNLIANAITHHDGDHGRVKVAARKIDSVWEFTVEDDGPGVPELERERIFQMLQRHGSSSGTGMGLALVHKTVTRVGGTVRAGASAAGGAAFRFTWPEPAPDAEEP